MSQTIFTPNAGSLPYFPSNSGSTITIPNSLSANNTNYTISTSANTPLAVQGKITCSDVEVDGQSVKEMMQNINDRLLILKPDPDKLEQYEALKIAYENFKVLEAMLK